MTVNDLHEVTFVWPQTDAGIVVVTGSFDNWSKSLFLTRGPNGFTGSIKIPWKETIAYKYIVDGRWELDDSKPKRVELGGYVNNVYVAPSRPPPRQEAEVTAKPETGLVPLHMNGTTNGTATKHNSVVNGAQDVPEATEVAEKMPAEFEHKTNGHVEMSEPQEVVPSLRGADESITDAVMSVPVDRHQGGDDTTEEGVSPVKEEMKEETPSDPVPVEATVVDKPDQPTDMGARSEEAVSQVISPNGSPATSTSPGRKRSLNMSFVPVNVASEAAVVDGSLQTDPNSAVREEASTHKPLGQVPKPSQSPTEQPDLSVVEPQTEEAKTTGEGQALREGTSVKGVVLPTETTGELVAQEPQPTAGPENKINVSPVLAEEQTAPEAAATEPPAPAKTAPAEGVQEGLEPSSAGNGKTPPADAATSEPATTSPNVSETKPVDETKPKGKSSSAPSSPTKARFPRMSRESSASERPQNGAARKRKSTFLDKIKHMFSHNKEKEKGKGKK